MESLDNLSSQKCPLCSKSLAGDEYKQAVSQLKEKLEKNFKQKNESQKESYDLELPSQTVSIEVEQVQNINANDSSDIENNWVNPHDCRHLTFWDTHGKYSLFMSADGVIHPCCFWEDERKEIYDL